MFLEKKVTPGPAFTFLLERVPLWQQQLLNL